VFGLEVRGLEAYAMKGEDGVEFVRGRVKEVSGNEGRKEGRVKKMVFYRRGDELGRGGHMLEGEFKKDLGEGGIVKVDLSECCWRYRVNEGVMLRVIGKFAGGGGGGGKEKGEAEPKPKLDDSSTSSSDYAIFFTLHSPLVYYVSPPSPSVTPATFLLSVDEVKVSTVNMGGQGVRWKAGFKGVEGRVGNKRIEDIGKGKVG